MICVIERGTESENVDAFYFIFTGLFLMMRAFLKFQYFPAWDTSPKLNLIL